MTQKNQCSLDSPLGPLLLVSSGDKLTQIAWGAPASKHTVPALACEHPVLAQAAEELCAYFAGSQRSFSVALDARGTAFQQAVWDALRKLPYGEIVSYGDLAKRLGNPRGARAVGGAVGANPIPIMIPCHRVLGAGRRLGGFTGGLAVKRQLLALEGIHWYEHT
jgi:methylated-DNA-[protein]-cysteine S-methyltransferase